MTLTKPMLTATELKAGAMHHRKADSLQALPVRAPSASRVLVADPNQRTTSPLRASNGASTREKFVGTFCHRRAVRARRAQHFCIFGPPRVSGSGSGL
jgi:hypothetical protein